MGALLLFSATIVRREGSSSMIERQRKPLPDTQVAGRQEPTLAALSCCCKTHPSWKVASIVRSSTTGSRTCRLKRAHTVYAFNRSLSGPWNVAEPPGRMSERGVCTMCCLVLSCAVSHMNTGERWLLANPRVLLSRLLNAYSGLCACCPVQKNGDEDMCKTNDCKAWS